MGVCLVICAAEVYVSPAASSLPIPDGGPLFGTPRVSRFADMYTGRGNGDRAQLAATRPSLGPGGRSTSSFDAIRLIAAFAVLVSHHFGLVRGEQPLVPGFGSLGVFAVTVFFVISGYFVALSWDREPDPVRYWKKRALRILPALVVVVGISILIIGPAETNLSLGDYATNAATWSYWRNAVLVLGIQFDLPGVFTAKPMSAVNLSLWSLPIELIMYVSIVIAGIALRRFSRWAYPVLATIFALAWWIIPGDQFGTTLQTLNLGVFFLAGAAIYSFGLLRRITPSFLAVCVVVVVLAAALDGPQTKLLLWIFFPMVVLGLGALPSALGKRVAAMGDISYGVYLWAFPIQQIVIAHLLGLVGFWVSMLLAAIVTTALALASWHLVERPALRLRDRGNTRPETVPADERRLVLPNPSPDSA